MKKDKMIMIITSFITILPAIIGLLLWNKLPDTIATHFGTDNVANGWSSKPFAVFGMPGMMLLIHWVCVIAMWFDPKRKNIGDKMMAVVVWIVPVLSLVVSLLIYGIALGINLNVGLFINAIIGVLFIVIGIFMPRSQQSYTVGIKLPWTLESEENWNRTHKLAGKLWIVGGVLFLINSFFLYEWALLVILIPMVGIPMGYSFWLYRKGI